MAEPERSRLEAAYAARRTMAERYDPRRSDVIARDAARATAWGRVLRKHGHDLDTVVEVGCGAGSVLRWIDAVGARRAIGVEPIDDRVSAAARAVPSAAILRSEGQHLPVRRASVDTVVFSTVFSSILDDEVAKGVASETVRVLRPGGLVLWFDFVRDNPRNTDVRGVPSSAIARWFSGFQVDLERVALLPPLARRLERWPRLAAVLEAFPPLRTHVAGALVAPR